MNKKILIGILATLVVVLVGLILLFFINNKTYTVTFDTVGGSRIPVVEIKKGNKVNRPVDPTKDGYQFVRWEYQNYEYDFNSSVNNDITLTAIWQELAKYKITFTLDKITKTVETRKVSEIDLYSLGFEEKSGYVIKWYLNDEEYKFDTTLNGDLNLVGKYEKATEFTVKFNSDGGSTVSDQTVKIDEKVKEPAKITKNGYIFDGWYLNGKKYDFNTPVTTNMTLVAKWKEDASVKRYTVTFNSDGGSSVSSQTIIDGNKVSRPSNPTRSGYIFKEWQLDGKAYDFNSAVKGNITLKAVWEKEKEKYTITFNSDGGSSVSNQTVVEGNKVTKPSNPTKDGYTFKEWQLGGKAYDFNTTVTKNITLKAVWTELEKYTVTFNSDGGSSVSSQIIIDGNKAIKPSDPIKSGYIFKEWQLNGKTYDFNTTVTKNITLKAVWEKEKEKYTVTFNSDGGSSVPNQTIVEGNKVTKPSNPTKDGYTFKEWQLNGNVYDFNSVVNGNITLKAVWIELEKYTVTFNSNGGSSVPNQTITVGNKITKPSNPTKEGHTFVEWQLNGSAYDFNSAVNGNITLNAVWQQKTYVIIKTSVDAYSPDVKLSVKENNASGQSVSFTNIKYGSVIVCTSSNPTVNRNDIDGITSLTVTLSSGTTVSAIVVG